MSLAKKGSIPWNKGIPWKEEDKKKHTNKTLKKGPLNGFYGKHHTLETRQKLSEQQLAISDVLSKRMSNLWWNPDTRPIMLAAHEKKSKEMDRGKLSESLKKRRPFIKIPLKDTKPEKMLQIALALEGIKFEKHKPITGQPDIFIEPNLCIFVDGDYWHKLPMNIKHDQNVNNILRSQGYKILRIWTSKMKKDFDGCIKGIISTMKETQRGFFF